MNEEYPPEGNETEETPLQIDVYGVKARLTPGEAEPPPKTWREVWKRVHQSLMSIATEPFSLIADTLSSARVLIKGVATLPESISQRVAGAHSQIEQHEHVAEQDVKSLTLQQSQILENVQTAVANLRAQGLVVELTRLENGRLKISISTPDQQLVTDDLAQSAIQNTIDIPLLETEAESESTDE